MHRQQQDGLAPNSAAPEGVSSTPGPMDASASLGAQGGQQVATASKLVPLRGSLAGQRVAASTASVAPAPPGSGGASGHAPLPEPPGPSADAADLRKARRRVEWQLPPQHPGQQQPLTAAPAHPILGAAARTAGAASTRGGAAPSSTEGSRRGVPAASGGSATSAHAHVLHGAPVQRRSALSSSLSRSLGALPSWLLTNAQALEEEGGSERLPWPPPAKAALQAPAAAAPQEHGLPHAPLPAAARGLGIAGSAGGHVRPSQEPQALPTTASLGSAASTDASFEEASVLGAEPSTGPGRAGPTRSGRGGGSITRVASISEIEPLVEEEHQQPRPSSSSLLTRALMIPYGSERPRTYRVATSKRQGSAEDVTVVLEGCDSAGVECGDAPAGAAGGSVHGGRVYGGPAYGALGAGVATYGSSLPNSGTGAPALLGSSLLSGSFLGGLTGSLFGRAASGARAAGPGSAVPTPDSSVHGNDALPYAARERYGPPDAPPLASAFGSLPTGGSSLVRARAANASAGAILGRATGGLKSQMRKCTSLNNFAALAAQQGAPYQGAGAGAGGSGGAAHLHHLAASAGGSGAPSEQPSSASGAGGRRAPRSSVNGGSGGSSTATSLGNGGGSGLGFWMRSASLPRAGRGSSSGTGAPGGDSGGTGGGWAGGGGGGRPFEPGVVDLAALATSLPASLGTWSLPRSVALAGSPHGYANRSLSRANSNTSAAASAGGLAGAPGGSGAPGSAAAPCPPSYPICLICLEMLTPEEFEAGDALALQCACKGEVALRHRKCAIEWSHHKGDVVCDICKQPIANLPPIPDEVLAAREAARRRRQPAFNTAPEPNLADYIFDCIRATWVTMIVCVLFFDLTVGQAFAVGAATGVGFALISAVVAACARRARARAAARAVERAAAESRAQEQEQQRQQRERQRQQRERAGGSGSRAGSPSLTEPLLPHDGS